MKNWLKIFVLSFMVMLNAQLVSAADTTWVDEEFDLTSIHRLYFGDMNYAQTQDSPKASDIMSMLAAQGSQTNMMILQHADLERLLLRDYKIDLPSLDEKQAKTAIKENLGKYVDAYVVPTIVHNQRVVMFFDVYSVTTGKMVLSYQAIAGTKDEDDITTYQKLTKNFYKELEKQAKVKK